MLNKFVRKKAEHFNLSEMSIAWGILTVIAIFVAVSLAVLLNALGVNDWIALITPVVLWVSFVVWLWISFVLIGRTSPQERISTIELTAMQILCGVIVAVHALFAGPDEQSTWDQIGSMFEWVIVGFHAIYFTLAWGWEREFRFAVM